jgi:hypothetical protein
MTPGRRLSGSGFLKLEKRVSFDPPNPWFALQQVKPQIKRDFGSMPPACAWEKLLTTSIAIGESKAQSPPCESENESVSAL